MAEIRVRTLVIVAASILTPLVAWIALDLLIETDREQIKSVLDAMAGGVSRGEEETVLAHVALDYYHQGLTREDLRALAQAYFVRFGRTNVRVAAAAISVGGSRAVANVAASWRAERGEAGGFRTPTRWQVTLARRNGRWEVIAIAPLSIGDVELSDWGAIVARLGVPVRGVPPF